VIRFAFLLFIIFWFSNANAQDYFPSEKVIDEYEIVAGGGILLNRGNDYAVLDRMNKYGYSFGIGANKFLSRNFFLNVRILYDLRGFRSNENYYNIDGTPGSTIIDRSINYVSFYFIPTVRIGSKKNIFAGVGGFYGLLDQAQDQLITKNQNNQVISTRTLKTSENTKNDVGLSVRAGYSFNLKNNKKIKIEIVDNVGLVYFTESFGYPIKSNSLSVLLSFSVWNR